MNARALVLALALALASCTTAPRTSITPPRAVAPPAAAGVAGAHDAGKAIAANAAAMMGQPYRWGGAAPGGFDCSGLVAYAAGGAGIHVPRTAAEQMRVGVAVLRPDLRPGDLIFMHLTRKELHVGIALDGVRFIHAPSTGGHVRVDMLDAPPYARGFLAARRIAGG